MNIRFFIDPETNEPHIFNHNVTEEEVIEALHNAAEERRARNHTRAVIGQTKTGRYLRLYFAPEPGGIIVITAYDLPEKQLKAFRRRRK